MALLVDEAVISRARQIVRCASQRRHFLHQAKLDQKEQELSEAERWKEVFLKTDADGNGVLSQAEIRRLIRKTLRLSERTIPESTLMMIFKYVDVNGDNSISFTEFYDFLSQGSPNDIAAQEKSLEKMLRNIGRSMMLAWRRNHLQSIADIDRFLEKHDLHEDTKFTYATFNKFFREVLKLTPHEVSDHNIRSLFKALDSDGERLLPLDELSYFIHIYANPAEGDNFGLRATGSESIRAPRTRMPSVNKRRHVQASCSLPFSLKGREVPDRSRMSLNDLNAHLRSAAEPSRLMPPTVDVDAGSSSVAKRLSIGAGLAAARPRTAAGAKGSISAAALPSADRPVSAPVRCKRPSNVSQSSSSSLPSSSAGLASRGGGTRRAGDETRPQSAPGGLNSGTPGNYRIVHGAETLNRIEQRMFEAGVDVRGQLHRLQSSPQLGRRCS